MIEFSPVRFSSPSNRSLTPRTALTQYSLVDENNSGKHGQVFIVTHDGGTPERDRDVDPTLYAIKSQRVREHSIRDRAVRELAIFKELSALHARSLCFNFVFLYDHFEVETVNVESLLAKPATAVASPHTPVDQRSGPAAVQYVLEFAGKTLTSFQGRSGEVLDLREYREVVFQMVYALYVAGAELGFTHYDLHSKNILLHEGLPMGRPRCVFIDGRGEEADWWEVAGRWTVKITDFGHARLRTKKEGIVLGSKRDVWAPHEDLASVAAALGKLVKPVDRATPGATQLLHDVAEFRRQLVRGRKHGLKTSSLDHMRSLLRHKLFAPLALHPSDRTKVTQRMQRERDAVVVASKGLRAIPPAIRGCALFPMASPKSPEPPVAKVEAKAETKRHGLRRSTRQTRKDVDGIPKTPEVRFNLFKRPENRPALAPVPGRKNLPVKGEPTAPPKESSSAKKPAKKGGSPPMRQKAATQPAQLRRSKRRGQRM